MNNKIHIRIFLFGFFCACVLFLCLHFIFVQKWRSIITKNVNIPMFSVNDNYIMLKELNNGKTGKLKVLLEERLEKSLILYENMQTLSQGDIATLNKVKLLLIKYPIKYTTDESRDRIGAVFSRIDAHNGDNIK